MALPEILIGSKFDAKGFKQAETAADKLGKSIKKLAYSFGLVFSAQRLVAFGKASVKAFAADENAARSLGMTLKNLNLNYFGASDSVNNYISSLEKQTGVLDDELRPAMDRLLRATGSITDSQKLLNLALDISAGTGKDLTTVSQGLQKAYLGNNASLGRLGVGLSKAELTTSSFSKIQTRLTELFAGQAQSAANGYLGSLNKLTIASNNAKEIIGKDLLDAMSLVAGKEGIGGAASAMEEFATQIGNAIYGVGVLTKQLNSLPGGDIVGKILKLNFEYSLLGILGKFGASSKPKAGQASPGGAGGVAATIKYQKEQAKILKETNALNKIQNKDIKEKLELTAGEKALAELKKMFDIDAIEIQAALNGTISEEDRLRLNALKAINEGDTAMALLAASALAASKASTALADTLDRATVSSSTFYTKQALATQAANADYFNSLFPSTGTSNYVYPGASSNDMLKPSVSDPYGGYSGQASSNGFYFPSASPQPSSIVVNVSGSVTTERDLVSAITQGIYNNQASGVPINYTTQY